MSLSVTFETNTRLLGVINIYVLRKKDFSWLNVHVPIGKFFFPMSVMGVKLCISSQLQYSFKPRIYLL